MKTLTNKKGTLQVEWNENNTKSGIVLVLKQGSMVKPLQSSADKLVKSLRDTTTTTDASGNLITTKDITFNSKSSLAAFIQGCSTNGDAYCERHFGIPRTPKDDDTISKPSSKAEEKTTTTEEENIEKSIEDSGEKVKDALAKSIMTFCKDFEFKPDPRLLNSILFESDPSQFIVNSMELVGFDEDLLQRAKDKFRSMEWKNIIKTLKSLKPSHTRFNQRLEIKYGSAGTGKTTAAIAEYPTAHKLVASASADPDDLFTFFDPSTKKYELTDIAKAMVEGKPIIIDEANLYNGVVLQRLQGITDSTNSIFDRGMELKIAEGFKVIMTLNLETNMGRTPLPNPLVSRASKIENYDNLLNLGWVW